MSSRKEGQFGGSAAMVGRDGGGWVAMRGAVANGGAGCCAGWWSIGGDAPCYSPYRRCVALIALVLMREALENAM